VAELESAWSQSVSSGRVRAAIVVGRVACAALLVTCLASVVGGVAGMSGRVFGVLYVAAFVLTIVNVLIAWGVILAMSRVSRQSNESGWGTLSPARSSGLARLYFVELIGAQWARRLWL
jgi:hypothetical protein